MRHFAAGTAFALVALLVSGCKRHEMYDAPLESSLQVRPASIEVGKSSYFYAKDNLGLAFMVDAIVTSTSDKTDGMPLGNIRVEVMTGGAGVYVLPPSAITTHDFTAPDNWEQIRNDECYDENGNFINSDNPYCAWLTDETSGYAYEIADSFAQPEDFAPNYMRMATDSSTGVARFWLFVDALPYNLDGEATDYESAEQGDAAVYVSTSISDTVLTIQTVN
jgi:hypothetical protein